MPLWTAILVYSGSQKRKHVFVPSNFGSCSANPPERSTTLYSTSPWSPSAGLIAVVISRWDSRALGSYARLKLRLGHSSFEKHAINSLFDRYIDQRWKQKSCGGTTAIFILLSYFSYKTYYAVTDSLRRTLFYEGTFVLDNRWSC